MINQETTRLDRAGVLRKLVDQIDAGLPAPISIRMYDDSAILSIGFADSVGQRAWADVFGLTIDKPRRHPSLPIVMHTGYARSWCEWSVQSSGDEPLAVDELVERRDRLVAELADLDAKLASPGRPTRADGSLDHGIDPGATQVEHYEVGGIKDDTEGATFRQLVCACDATFEGDNAGEVRAAFNAHVANGNVPAVPVAVSPERVAEMRLDADRLAEIVFWVNEIGEPSDEVNTALRLLPEWKASTANTLLGAVTEFMVGPTGEVDPEAEAHWNIVTFADGAWSVTR